MWESLFGGVKNYLGKGDWLGEVIGGAGSLWGAYNQQKMGKKMFDLQKDAYNYNKMLSQNELNRRDKFENDLWNAYNNSSYGRV